MGDRAGTSGRARGALAGLVAGYALLALVAGAPGSPLVPPLPDGVSTPWWAARGAAALGLDRLSYGQLVAVSLCILAGLVGLFALLLVEAWRGHARPGTVLIVSAVAIGVAVAAPLLLSRDVYSYASYGRMVALHDANPYASVPAAFPADPFTPVVSAEWFHTRSVYGPVFTLLSAGIARAWTGSPGATVLAFKVLAGLAAAGATALVASSARAVRPERVAFAAALVGLNPVIVVHTVGGGHNDALIALGLAGALALATSTRARPARSPTALLITAALSLTALVKVVAAIPLLLWVATAIRRSEPGRRVRTAAAHAGLAALITLAATAPVFSGWHTVTALANLASRQGWASPARLVARAAIGPGLCCHWLESGVTGVVFALFLLPVVLLVWRLLRERDARPVADAWGSALLLFALAAPYLLPWYVAWFVVPLALMRDGGLIVAGVAAASVLALTGIPAEPAASPGLWRDMLLAVHYVAAPAMLVLFAITLRRVFRRPVAAAG